MAYEQDNPPDGKPGKAAHWKGEIEQAKKRSEDFRAKGEKILKKFKDQSKENDHRFNILWSNTEIQKSAILSNNPKAEVVRRFKDEDPVARHGSMVLERALDFVIDDQELYDAFTSARDDALLPGWGVVRVVYDADFEDVEGDEEQVKRPGTDRAYLEYVPWDQVYFSDSTRWRDVYWMGFRHEMRKHDCEEHFGYYDEDLMPLTLEKAGEETKCAEVFEIWDRDERKVCWYAIGGEDTILEEDDPLGLGQFYPITKPLIFLGTNDSLYPLAEYLMYQDQARELNEVNRRIVRLVSMLKVAGMYDSVTDKIPDLVNMDDGELIPIETAGELRAKGGLDQSIFFLPINTIAEVVQSLFAHRESLKQQIYELTGISDLMRGSTDPNETARAQNLKAQYGASRSERKTRPMALFVRDALRLLAEVMAEHFDDVSLQAMTGLPVQPQVMALLRNDKLRRFRIDIETGSTIAVDEAEAKREMTEFVTAITQFLQAATQVPPTAMPMMMELFKQIVREHGFGRRMEEVIDQTADQIVKASQQPPGPDPTKMAEIKAKLEDRKMQEQGDTERALLDAQIELVTAMAR